MTAPAHFDNRAEGDGSLGVWLRPANNVGPKSDSNLTISPETTA